MKYKYHLLLVVLSDAKIGSTLGRDLALSSLGRRQSKRGVTAQTWNESGRQSFTIEGRGGEG